MPSALKIIGGGLLSGFGKGLLEQGKADGLANREAARDKLQQTNRLEVQDVQHKNRGIEIKQRGARDDARQVRLIEAKTTQATTATTRKTEAVEVADKRLRRRDVEKDQRLAGRERAKDVRKLAASKGGLTASDKRTIDLVIKRHTGIGGRVDDDAVIKQLKVNGRGDLARFWAGEQVGPDGRTFSVLSAEALKEAEAEASDKAGFTTSDATDFKADGGNRATFITRRAKELLRGKMGRPEPQGDAIIDITGSEAEKRAQLGRLPAGARVRVNGRVAVKQASGGFVEVADPLAGASDAALKKAFRGQPNLN